MDTSADLRVLLASQYPLLLVATREEQRFLELLRRAAAGLGLPVWIWSASRGLARDGMDPMYGTAEPQRALGVVADLTDPGIFVFTDAHHPLEDPVTLRAVKDAAMTATPGQTIVLSTPRPVMPPELESLAVPWTLRPPDRSELAAMVRTALEDLTATRTPVRLSATEESAIVDALAGLTMADAERLLQRAAIRDGTLGPDDIAFLRAEKAGMLNADGVLEIVERLPAGFEGVGGLDGLKAWLAMRGRALQAGQAGAAGLDAPRGILLTGVPGCGKSLAAKALAAEWHRPLVLLDPSRLYGRYVGESEERLTTSLATVETMSPIVLWIDEIEKGFAAGGDGDGGVSRRLLGTFLRWLQERPDGVFVVATANDVAALPPEFLRKGRFDEVFFVDLPGGEARRAIFSAHLRGRGHDPARFDLDGLSARSDGFSGAEIEAAVVGALYRAFGAGQTLTTRELAAEIGATVPLSVSRREDVARLRAWASTRAVPAG
ncbi:MAG: AAA family ATPase [Actinobacteria bacterium]|nr:AAA family ATPase [Actinomycetota bacterium]